MSFFEEEYERWYDGPSEGETEQRIYDGILGRIGAAHCDVVPELVTCQCKHCIFRASGRKQDVMTEMGQHMIQCHTSLVSVEDRQEIENFWG